MDNNYAVGSALLVQITNVVDAGGNPAQLTAPIAWSTSDSTILNLTPAADGMSATGSAQKTGTVTVTVTANGITESTSIDVIGGAPVSFQLSVSLVTPATPAS
jgi:hypothetical protein